MTSKQITLTQPASVNEVVSNDEKSKSGKSNECSDIESECSDIESEDYEIMDISDSVQSVQPITCNILFQVF